MMHGRRDDAGGEMAGGERFEPCALVRVKRPGLPFEHEGDDAAVATKLTGNLARRDAARDKGADQPVV